MKQRREVLIATRNRGKIREIEDALRLLPLQLRYLSEFPSLTSVAEVGQTYRANAVLKAEEYSKLSGVCALADDSGLEVDVLGGEPGVRSARFAGESASDSDRIAKLLQALSGCPDDKRTARFVCSMAFVGWAPSAMRTSTPQILETTEGICEGLIGHTARGENGFGFDPIFVPHGYNQTFAELGDEVKASISHRALALRSMRVFLKRWLAT
jgi:XTP/dITP diphosphohydrolase